MVFNTRTCTIGIWHCLATMLKRIQTNNYYPTLPVFCRFLVHYNAESIEGLVVRDKFFELLPLKSAREIRVSLCSDER